MLIAIGPMVISDVCIYYWKIAQVLKNKYIFWISDSMGEHDRLVCFACSMEHAKLQLFYDKMANVNPQVIL